MKKYKVYENDLKFKELREINPDDVEWNNINIKKNYNNINCDNIEYRILECKNNNDTYLDLSNMNLTKLIVEDKYINELVNVKYLFLNNNKLDKIDLSLFKYLEVLDISYNNLTEIINLPLTLRELCCNNNNLTFIESHNNLVRLECSNNKLIELNNYPNLELLKCENNRLINISSYPVLKKLYCMSNPLISIKENHLLEILNCSMTDITELINFSNLKELICTNSKLHTINKTNPLQYLEISHSAITKLDYFPKLKDFIYANTTDLLISPKYKIKNYTKLKGHVIIVFEI